MASSDSHGARPEQQHRTRSGGHQWHVIGMFAPSFFAERLIRRVGVLNVLLTVAAPRTIRAAHQRVERQPELYEGITAVGGPRGRT